MTLNGCLAMSVKLVEGLTYAVIAARLVVSVNTVRFHVKDIYGKLGATLPSRLCDVRMRVASSASLRVDKPCDDGDPRFSIGIPADQ